MKKSILFIGLLLAMAPIASAQCLAPAWEDSGMSPNPENEINGIFKFDYKIKSNLKYSIGGSVERLQMDYYVNTADGSILFPSGPIGFFNTNLGTYQNADGRIDGAIWLTSGQMVLYVYDADRNMKRAITRTSSQTADGRIDNDLQSLMQFFTSSEELQEFPEPMPSYFQWRSPTQGYVGELVEARTGLNNRWTLYMDTDPTPIKTSVPMVGFMVGVLKDARETRCNRLVVYSKVEIGGAGSDDYIETSISQILPAGITFNASEYKPTLLGGDPGTAVQGQMARLEAMQLDILRRKEDLKLQRRRCRLKLCHDRIDREEEELQKEEDALHCQMARALGMEDMTDACN